MELGSKDVGSLSKKFQCRVMKIILLGVIKTLYYRDSIKLYIGAVREFNVNLPRNVVRSPHTKFNVILITSPNVINEVVTRIS